MSIVSAVMPAQAAALNDPVLLQRGITLGKRGHPVYVNTIHTVAAVFVKFRCDDERHVFSFNPAIDGEAFNRELDSFLTRMEQRLCQQP